MLNSLTKLNKKMIHDENEYEWIELWLRIIEKTKQKILQKDNKKVKTKIKVLS